MTRGRLTNPPGVDSTKLDPKTLIYSNLLLFGYSNENQSHKTRLDK